MEAQTQQQTFTAQQVAMRESEIKRGTLIWGLIGGFLGGVALFGIILIFAWPKKQDTAPTVTIP